ncbi:aldo/keto reductase [Streptomyces sp. NPDC002088]|uniref:aldo/keto reductase n=1 Tax=Streptomyces sp. NPDC002088 TaxID=3154665 RepID=UPI00331EF257
MLPLQAALARGVVAVDMNDDHLAAWRLDPHGNPVGEPNRYFYDLTGSTTHRDAQIRHALTRLVHHTRATGAAAIAVEDLDFTDGRCREKHGRNKRFRRLISRFPASDIVEAQWVAERRGLVRFRTEQPPYSILNRSIEREVLPVCERYGMGTMIWSPLAGGLLTGRYRKDRQADTHRAAFGFQHLRDERRLHAVEQLLLVADKTGIPLTHLAMAFAIAHPGVTSAIIGPRTMDHLDDLLAGAEITLPDDVLDEIDAIVPPGTDVGTLDMAYNPPAIEDAALRRRPADGRSAA